MPSGGKDLAVLESNTVRIVLESRAGDLALFKVIQSVKQLGQTLGGSSHVLELSQDRNDRTLCSHCADKVLGQEADLGEQLCLCKCVQR